MSAQHTESSDLLSILNQLHPHALSNRRVRLLRFDADLLEDYALCVRGAAEGGGFVGGSEEALLVVQIGPAASFAGGDELSGCVEPARFASVCQFGKGG